eukprot:3307412-Amphidinium_carterae.1
MVGSDYGQTVLSASNQNFKANSYPPAGVKMHHHVLSNRSKRKSIGNELLAKALPKQQNKNF